MNNSDYISIEVDEQGMTKNEAKDILKDQQIFNYIDIFIYMGRDSRIHILSDHKTCQYEYRYGDGWRVDTPGEYEMNVIRAASVMMNDMVKYFDNNETGKYSPK